MHIRWLLPLLWPNGIMRLDGLVILCLHDFGDVWLNWAKVFKSERVICLFRRPAQLKPKRHTDPCSWLPGVCALLLHRYLGADYDAPCTALFVTFAVAFFLTRLVFLPVTVIPSVSWRPSRRFHFSNWLTVAGLLLGNRVTGRLCRLIRLYQVSPR